MSKGGQALMIGVFMMLLLFLTIPMVIFLNQSGGLHQMSSVKRAKAFALSEGGVTDAIQRLSTPATWSANLAAASGCSIAGAYTSPNGGSYTLECSTGGLTKYQ